MTQDAEARSKNDRKLPTGALILKFASILSFDMQRKDPVLNDDDNICCAVLQ